MADKPNSPRDDTKAPGLALALKKPGARKQRWHVAQPEDQPDDPGAAHALQLPRLADLAEAFASLPRSISEFGAAWAKAAKSERHAPNLERFLAAMPEADQRRFLATDLPAMLAICAALPTHLPLGLHRLRCGEARTIELKREAVAGIVCCGFFCLWPPPPSTHYPEINFYTLYQNLGASQERAKLEMFMNYFRRIAIKLPTGKIALTRKVNSTPADWARSPAELSEVVIEDSGVIEDRQTALQVDFANKYIGGGVISGGCVQEEIRFSINPECLASCLLCEVMQPDEAVLIVGTECFSKYKGYAGSLCFGGDHIDATPVVDGVIQTRIIAIDALDLRWPGRRSQYREELFVRELNKAYVGFMRSPGESITEVATGNWGCGAFLGDKQLKALLQWLAASHARRKLIYYTFGEKKFAAELREMVALLQERKPIVSEVFHAAMAYPAALDETGVEFFEFMKEKMKTQPGNCGVM